MVNPQPRVGVADIIAVVGVACVIGGLALVYVPLGLISFGLVLIGLAVAGASR